MTDIFTVAPVTWTIDTPIPNANTFNLEIRDKFNNIINSVADKTTAQTLTNKTLMSPVINTPTGDVATLTGIQTLTNKTLTNPGITDKHAIGTDNGPETLGNKTLTSPKIDNIVAESTHITLTPAANTLVRIAVLRQNITTNTYINNTIILTGWTFILSPNAAGISKTIGFGITFSEVPIITITPIGKKAGSDPTSIADFYSHGAIEAGKVLNPSITGFLAHIWTTSAYDLNDRVGFMWTAIGQLN